MQTPARPVVELLGNLRKPRAGLWAMLLGISLGLIGPAVAGLPPANSVIGNQASATYKDESGQTNVATSNLVETLVQQVGSLTLIQDNSKIASTGNTVYMLHLLSNTGNGADSFKLTLGSVAGDFEASGIAIYPDANLDGVPDSTTALCTGYPCDYVTADLAAGATFGFVVAMTVPGGTADGNADSLTVTATATQAALYTTPSAINTDTLTVTTGAAFQVTKSVSSSVGPKGVTLKYTLTYRNIGASAGNLAIRDVIGSGATAGFEYVAGSARWSAGSSVLGDNAYVAGNPDATVGSSDAYYQAITNTGVTTINATFVNIASNVTGSVTFDVLVRATAATGTATTTNLASFGVDGDTDPTNNTLTGSTNESPYFVQAAAGVVFNDGGDATDGNNTRPASGDTDSPNNDDLSYVASASPGQTLVFDNYVWNTGSGTDTFNVTVQAPGSPSWPTGTSFQLYKLDGASPLTDSNGDGTPDTGPIASGASYKVVLRVTLPASACSPTCPTGPFDLQKTATSVQDPTKSNVTFDRLGALAAPAVDLANSSGTVGPTDQDAVGASPTTTLTVAPGGSVVFDLFVRNEGSATDTYGLAYSTSNFSAGTVPAGWTVQFRTTVAGACSATGGSVITSIGPLAAGAEQQFCAVVAVPTGTINGTTSLYFRVLSGVTGAVNVKHDAVTVGAVNQLTLQPSHTGQVSPGGTVVYPHLLVNSGNTTCGPADAYTFSISQTLASEGWTYVLYRDANGNGAIDASDSVIDPLVGLTGLTLLPGESVPLLVRVFAPAGASAGATDVVSLAVTGGCNGTPTTSNTATDTSMVVVGQVRVLKTQAIDHDCSGTPSLPAGDSRTVGGSFSAEPMQAKPGECLLYRVVATNEGLGNVIELVLADTLPTYTDFSGGPTCSKGTGSYVAPTFRCSDTAPQILLAPAESATMEFRVKVQN